MKLARSHFSRTLGLAVFTAALLATGAARADEYGDVNQLLRAGKPTEALAKADQYLAGKPKDPQMRFIKGVALTEAGRTNEAITTFQKLTEDYPELPEPYNNLAVLYAGQGQFDKARAALEMAIRTNPSYATAHENLGDVYAKLASQAYSRALQLDASNTAVPPKLALIRELFTTSGHAAASHVGATTTVATAPAAPVHTAATAPAPAAAHAPAAAPAAQPKPAPAAHPVAAGPTGASAATPAPASDEHAAAPAARDVESAVHAWASAWAAKDMNAYLAAYGKDFDPPGKQSRQAWEAERRARILGKKHISVQITDLKVSVNGDKATAHFRQAYSADALHVSSRKTLQLEKSGDRWKIVRENSGA